MMRFNELHDPRDMAVDATGFRRWENGDVKVKLSDPNGLPDVMGLVGQAFEQQMGDVDQDA